MNRNLSKIILAIVFIVAIVVSGIGGYYIGISNLSTVTITILTTVTTTITSTYKEVKTLTSHETLTITNIITLKQTVTERITATTTTTSTATEMRTVHPSKNIAIIYAPKAVGVYQPLEIWFNISGVNIANPFDGREIDVRAIVISPSGKQYNLIGFYTQNYTITKIGLDQEIPVRIGEPFWAIRFTPMEIGTHRIIITAVTGGGDVVQSSAIDVDVVQSNIKSRGFVRVDPVTGRYLVFDDGEAMYMIGLNIAWPPSKFTAIPFYRDWFKKASENGVKVVRIGLVDWAICLECHQNFHRYSLDDAAIVDEILKLADEYDIYIIFVFMWHNPLSDGWNQNPYNVKNGGILEKPEEFWINRNAIDIFKDYVRYIVARYGYSPRIMAWEIMNEADLTTNFQSVRDQFVKWVDEISTYIKSIDPYKRPVTISLANYNSEPRIWDLKNIDIVNVHMYGPYGFRDIATSVRGVIESLWKRYRKPVIFTEFGVDWRWEAVAKPFKPYWALDKNGVGLHEGIWASLLTGTSVSAMSWWWDTQIDPYKLWYHFKALQKFITGIDPRKLTTVDAYVSIPIELNRPTSIAIYPSASWISHSPIAKNVYSIDPEKGVIGNMDLLSGFIYGTCHQQKAINPIFIVKFLDKGRMIIHVNSVGKGSARLDIYANGDLVKSIDLPDKDGLSEGAANEYNMDIAIDFEPGTYEIKIDNSGCDWFTWDFITFDNVVYMSYKVDVYGLSNSTSAFLWIRNRDYNWWNIVAMNKSLEPIHNITLSIRNIENGLYNVEYWDTKSGTIVKTLIIQVRDGVARIPIDVLVDDIAIKLYKSG